MIWRRYKKCLSKEILAGKELWNLIILKEYWKMKNWSAYPITPHISTPAYKHPPRAYKHMCLYPGHKHMSLYPVDIYKSVTKSKGLELP